MCSCDAELGHGKCSDLEWIISSELCFSLALPPPEFGLSGLLQDLVCRYSKGLVELKRTVQAQVFPLQCWALTSLGLEGDLAREPG